MRLRRAASLPLFLVVLTGTVLLVNLLLSATTTRWARFLLLESSPAAVRELGQHFVVAFDNEAEVAELAARGAIGGIYLGSGNVARHTPQEVRAIVARLQALRRQNNLPPLIVTADQEGGGVSRLSPPLPTPPALATLALQRSRMTAAEQQGAARLVGEEVGQGLCAMGVTMNLSPVVDLKSPRRIAGDARTQLYLRAVSPDPQEVIDLVAPYSEGLLSAGVLPVLKHFPGLGSVTVDTHLQPGMVHASLENLSRADWRPFQTLAQSMPVAIMVGHVVVPPIDPDQVATRSRRVVQGILREQMDFHGLVITDDLTMWPTLFGPGGIGQASVDALNAGVDLLLITWKHDEYYAAFSAVLEAYETGALDLAMHAQLEKHRQALSSGRCAVGS